MRELKIGEFVSVVRDGAVATVTMDRGDGRNALSRQLILEMTEAAKQFADDLETQAVILTGNGASQPAPISRTRRWIADARRAFSSGATWCASARSCATPGKGWSR